MLARFTAYELKDLLVAFVIAFFLTITPLMRFQNVSAIGDITMDTIVTSDPQPTLSGSGMYCTSDDGRDVDVTIANVYAQGTQMMTFSSATGQVSTSSNGTSRYWSLDLKAQNVFLPQGYYDVRVGFCHHPSPYGGPGSYYPAETFNNALRVIPATCNEFCVPIYRYYNLMTGAHVYTTSDAEKRQLYYTTVFRFEGVVGFAIDGPYDGGLALHRFYNKNNGTHFYTTNQTEASYINDRLYGTYRYEGIVAYVDSSQQIDSYPVHRFYNFRKGVHFYTANQSEASYVNDNLYATYRYEGVGYYVIK